MRAHVSQPDIEAVFVKTLNTCMLDFGVANVPVLQHFDYQKKGRRDVAIYFTVQAPRRIGNAYRDYNPVGSKANHVESLHLESDIQITVVSDELKTNINGGDLAMTVVQVVGSLPFIELMRAGGIGTQGCSDIRVINSTDEHDNYQQEYSLTVPVTYNREIKPNTATINIHELKQIHV